MSRVITMRWPWAMALLAAATGAWFGLRDRGDVGAVSEVQLEQRRAFAVLGTRPELPGPVMRDRIEAAAKDRDLSLDLRRAQRVVTSTDAVAWIVPGDGHLCLIQHRTAAATCDTARAAVRNGLALVVFEPPTKPEAVPKRYLALGLAPDGVEEVRVLYAASSRTVAVVDNVYSLRTVSPPRAQPLR